MMIVLVLAALALQSDIYAVSAGCPKLPPIPLTYPVYKWCITGPQVVNRTCTFVCVRGYSLETDPNRVFFRFVCQANGTWSGKVHKCVDARAPNLRCPDDITVTARKGSPSEMVSWKIDVDDNSIAVEPNAKVTLQSSHASPHNFTIGRHLVAVTATDKAGNKARCMFWVYIKDLEPPTCSFCPGDIVREGKSSLVRVSWDVPVCSDNSHLPPKIVPSRRNGEHYRVPGTYKIQYTVEDFAFPKPNIYTGCSFNIILKRPRCPMYPPPKNGALVCLNRDDGSSAFCQVVCQHGTDFVAPPAYLYICDDTGTWRTHYLFPNLQLPWPDCASGAGPSVVNNPGLSKYFFFNGNQAHSQVVSELKQKFLDFAKSPSIPPFYCMFNSDCKPEKVHVYV
ncbi:hypothetical protein ACROYT_G019744 [Oculina patagonica]